MDKENKKKNQDQDKPIKNIKKSSYSKKKNQKKIYQVESHTCNQLLITQ